MNYHLIYTRPYKFYKSQESKILVYCEENNIDPVKCFHEKSVNSRTELNRLFKNITSTSNKIIVLDTKILWNDIETKTLIISKLKQLNAHLIVLNNLEYSIYNDLEINADVIELITDFNHHALVERLSNARKEKAKKGVKSSGTTPIGYIWNDNGHIEKDPLFTDTVDTIFEKYLELKSLNKLVKYLDEAGMLSRNGNTFTKGSLQVILKNDFYISVIRHGNVKSEGKHTPIISHNLFDNVQELLLMNQRNK